MKPDDCYWNAETQRLVGNRISKIRRFLREGLIEDKGEGIFKVKPAKGRHLTHTVDIYSNNCTCQHNKRFKTDCSHILAVKLYLYQGRDKNGN